jgi:hypothetical protein
MIVAGKSIRRRTTGERFRSSATVRLSVNIVTMMIAAPGIEASGPVIAGCNAFAARRISARSKSVNWPTSRFPKSRSATRNSM